MVLANAFLVMGAAILNKLIQHPNFEFIPFFVRHTEI